MRNKGYLPIENLIKGVCIFRQTATGTYILVDKRQNKAELTGIQEYSKVCVSDESSIWVFKTCHEDMKSTAMYLVSNAKVTRICTVEYATYYLKLDIVFRLGSSFICVNTEGDLKEYTNTLLKEVETVKRKTYCEVLVADGVVLSHPAHKPLYEGFGIPIVA